jgi:hypothetical protein
MCGLAGRRPLPDKHPLLAGITESHNSRGDGQLTTTWTAEDWRDAFNERAAIL